MKWTKFIQDLENENVIQEIEFDLVFLYFPEFDYKRKYGISHSKLKKELLIFGKFQDLDNIGKEFKRIEQKEYYTREINELLDELASKCEYTTGDDGKRVESSQRSVSSIIYDLFKGQTGIGAKWLCRIILKSFKDSPWSRLSKYHPCATVLFKNQKCLKSLYANLCRINDKYTRIELMENKNNRIKAYQDYGKPIVVQYT